MSAASESLVSPKPSESLASKAKTSKDNMPRVMEVDKTDSPLKIAVVYSRTPIPMVRADQMTVANLVSYLHARGHSVDLFTLNNGAELTPDGREWLERHTNRFNFYDHGKFQIFKGLLAAVFKGWPLQLGYFYSPTLCADLEKSVRAGKYDIVYAYYVRSATALGGMFESSKTSQFSGQKTASFLAMQLSQSLNVERIYRNQKDFFKKIFYYFEWKRLLKYESRIWKKSTRVVLIGPKDVETVKDACRQQGQREIDNWVYGAHGTDTSKFTAAQAHEIVPGRIVFSGTMHYRPNIQAILWFVNNCWPAIQKAKPDSHLFLVGRNPAPEILALAKMPNITVTGDVPDVGVYNRSGAVCINPMQAGAGMQNKLIEYLASGKAVVATPVANEGIMAPPEAIREATTPDEFADAVIELLNNPELAARLGHAAREFATRDWTWEAHFKILENNFRETLLSSSGK